MGTIGNIARKKTQLGGYPSCVFFDFQKKGFAYPALENFFLAN
jgi:hypothetical protein